MYIDTQWYQMQSNTCMHDCLASPAKLIKIEWTIPVTCHWWSFFFLYFFNFASNCSPTTMLAARSLALSALFGRTLRSVAILWRWKAQVRSFFVVLPCFTFSIKLINRSNYLIIWWRSKWRFYVELCNLEMHIVLTCWPSKPTAVLHSLLDFWEPVFCLGNPAWHELNPAIQVVPWHQCIKGARGRDTCILRDVASFSKVMTQGISKTYPPSAKICCAMILIVICVSWMSCFKNVLAVGKWLCRPFFSGIFGVVMASSLELQQSMFVATCHTLTRLCRQLQVFRSRWLIKGSFASK